MKEHRYSISYYGNTATVRDRLRGYDYVIIEHHSKYELSIYVYGENDEHPRFVDSWAKAETPLKMPGRLAWSPRQLIALVANYPVGEVINA